MITAKECRLISNKMLGEKNNQLLDIEKKIKVAINKGFFKIEVYEKLSEHTIKILKMNGFIITPYDDPRETTTNYIITW